MTDDLEKRGQQPGISVRFEPPDVLFIVVEGEATPARASAAYDEIDRLAAGRDHVFAIVDTRRLTGVPPAVRKISAERAMRTSFRGSAFIGASVQMRALVSLLFRAFELFDARFKQAPSRFFGTEEEARAWIAERRRVVERERTS
jgi:hypothetical protein